MVSTINETVGTILLALFVLIVLGLLAYALYEYQLIRSFEVSTSVNPYCVRQLCTSDGNQKPGYEVPVKDDPTRFAYENLTYCLVNAPPCELVSAMMTCAGTTNPDTGLAEAEDGTSTNPTNDELTQILKFYNEDYYTRCNYQYGGGQIVPTADKPPTNPNTPTLVNGPNDDFLVALLGCSKKRFTPQELASNTDYQDLLKECGQVCQGTNSS